jgi:hypothetical protein
MDEVSSLGRLILPFVRRQGRPKDCSASFSDPIMEGPGADSEEKHEPARDIDTAAVDSLKALDPERPIREATDLQWSREVRFSPETDQISPPQ